MEIGFHHQGLAVDVHNGCFGSANGEFSGAEALNIGVFINLPSEKLNANDRRFDGVEWADYGYVDEPGV